MANPVTSPQDQIKAAEVPKKQIRPTTDKVVSTGRADVDSDTVIRVRDEPPAVEDDELDIDDNAPPIFGTKDSRHTG